MVTWRPNNVDGLDFSDRALIVTALRSYQSKVEAERNGSVGNGVASFAMEYISGRLGHLAEVIDPERDDLVAST